MLACVDTLTRIETSMFSHRQQLRRWAARVLLVWLFGVAVGVANACELGSLSDGGADALAFEHSASHGHDGGKGGADTSNCHAFCDKSSVSAPTWQSALDKFALTGLPAEWPIAPAFMPQPLPLPRIRMRHDGRGEPPIPIAFLRLTL